MARTPKAIVALSAVTATTTSDPIDITCAKKVSFTFTRANHSSGSSTFTVTGSVDGIDGTYVAINKLITNVANTNAQTPVRAASVALASDTSVGASLDLEHDIYTHIKVTVTEVTDGTHTARVLVGY